MEPRGDAASSPAARAPRPLDVTPALRAALAACRAYYEVTCAGRDGALAALLAEARRPPEIDLDALASVEEELGARLPDDLLAVLASRVPWLGLGIERLAELAHAAAAARCPSKLLPFADRGRRFVCVERRPAPREGLRLFSFSRESRRHAPIAPLSACALGEWVADEFNEVYFEFHQDDAERERVTRRVEIVAEHLLEGFRPAIVRSPPAAPRRRRVRHARFGEGVVLRVLDGGGDEKLEIDFGPAGTRLLLARFVEPLQDGGAGADG